MESFRSEIINVGSFTSNMFPIFSNTRIMMMPFLLEEPLKTLPKELNNWTWPVFFLCRRAPIKQGVAYLTIDEAFVKKGETHRRPGLHVDGVGSDGELGGSWGGGGGGYGSNGFLLVSSHVGCQGWHQEFQGKPLPEGDCSHLSSQCREDRKIVIKPLEVYWCNPLAVHESIPAETDMKRQFIRLSMPSNAPWYQGYTENPLGIKPTGPIKAPRTKFMNFRS